jgi:hypothetical protein
MGQAINCPSGFTTTGTGACSVDINSGTKAFYLANHGTILSGSSVILAPAGAGHQGNALVLQATVNVQAFTSTFTFIPNGQNIAFVVENQTNQNAQAFSSGAGDEAGFSQMAGGSNIAPDRVFALDIDSYGPLTSSTNFVYSSVQIFQTLQTPSLPYQTSTGYLAQFAQNKLSTSPVSLNSPTTTRGTTTGDTYSATVTYDGYTFSLSMFDVTTGGSCPGASCFTTSWSGVYIPEIVGATTAHIALTSGTSGSFSPPQLSVGSLVYTVNTPTGTPSYTAWNANSTYNTGTVSSASPVYSVAPGTYATTQTVAITTSTSPNNYICYVASATVPTLYPQPDNNGGCVTGTLYTAPVSIATTKTLYAMAGSNNSAYGVQPVSNLTGLGPPSTLVAGTYTISSSSAAVTPTFSPVAGTYSGGRSIVLSSTSPGAIICYNTTGAPATNGTSGCTTGTLYTGPIPVVSTQTIYAIAGGTGFIDSTVSSAAYTINPITVTARTVGKVSIRGQVVIK